MPALRNLVLRPLDDGAVGFFDRLAETGRARLKAVIAVCGKRAVTNKRADRLHRQPAGDLARGGAAHAVAYDEQSAVGVHEEGILVDRAHLADAGRRANLKQHWRYSLQMNWLVKEEPENYSYTQFLTDRTTVWAGVRNPVAQRNLREMKKGDRVFFYHTGKEKAVIGTATVSKTAYPDPKDEKLVVVELAAGKALKRPVTLAEIKADKRFQDMPLVRIARLSVQPVTDEQWEMVETMSKS